MLAIRHRGCVAFVVGSLALAGAGSAPSRAQPAGKANDRGAASTHDDRTSPTQHKDGHLKPNDTNQASVNNQIRKQTSPAGANGK